MRKSVRFALLFLVSTACLAPEERVEVGNSTAEVTAGSGSIQIETFGMVDKSTGGEGASLISNGMELLELSRIGSPQVDGSTVQATDVLIRDHLVYATYNTAGDVFSGALQIIDVSDPEDPQLLQEARFIQSEANRVRVQGEYIYVGGGDVELAATIDTFHLRDGVLEHLSTLALPGYQTTMLQIDGTRGYATTGDLGGVTLLDLSDPGIPAMLDHLPLDDARYVLNLDESEFVVLTGGAGAQLSRYQTPISEGAWMAPMATQSVQGVTVGAPSWGNRIGNDLYISADEGGVATFSLRDGSITPQSIVPTSGDANGLAPTPDQRVAVLANGQQGLIALDAQSADSASQLAAYDVPDDCGSANAIDVRHDLIAMADGLGGVKLLRYNLNHVGARLTTILLTFSNPGIPTEVASQLASQAVNWTSPRSPSHVLVVRDDRHNGEAESDTLFVVDLLLSQGYEVDYLEEPAEGIEPADVSSYDVVWFSNPGWPLDDRKSFDTLVEFSQSGGGVVLQGDDMTWTSSREVSLSPLTYLENIDNGTRFCGVDIDNNSGGKYRVTFEGSDHPVIAGLQGESFTYGDDIDHSRPLGQGEEVLAWATLDGDQGSCREQSPVVITFGPERAAELQGLF